MHLSLVRPRFTVRWLMIATAVFAALLAGWLKLVPYWELSRRYQERAEWYESMAQGHIARIDCWEILIAGKKKNPDFHAFPLELLQDQAKRDRIWLEYNRGLIAKYKRAARYPWRSFAPDPPDPLGNPPFPPIDGRPQS
jgi:hypothetical protein